jgi:transposase
VEGGDTQAVAAIANELAEHGCSPERIESVSIDMSPAFIKVCTDHLLYTRITFDNFHVLWHANAAVDRDLGL